MSINVSRWQSSHLLHVGIKIQMFMCWGVISLSDTGLEVCS